MTNTEIPPKPPSRRIGQLDFLRGLAVLLILMHHFPLIPVLSPIGWCGVDLFFVLSGFLVSGLIFVEYKNTKLFSIKRFLIRRGLKIYPMFYLFLLISIAFTLVASAFTSYQKDNLGQSILSEIFFLQSYINGIWGHTWSLAVEEHFYLLLSVLLLFCTKTKLIDNKWLFPLLIIAINIVILCIRTYSFSEPYDSTKHYTSTHVRIDSLFYGVLLSYFYFLRDLRLTTSIALLTFLLGVICVSITLSFPLQSSHFMPTFGFSLLAIGFGAMLIGLVNVPLDLIQKIIPRHLFDVVCATGKYSYAIYLYHMFVPVILKKTGFYHDPVWRPYVFIFYVIAVYFAGKIITCTVEEKVLKFRDNHFPRAN